MSRDNKRTHFPDGRPFPEHVLARRAKHEAMKAANPERYMSQKELADKVKDLDDKVKDLDNKVKELEKKP